jgi:hypothetical protein
MARFGGNEFTSFSVPLVFDGRYFVLEPGKQPLLTVFAEHKGELVFEVLKNKPVDNPITDVSTNASGVVTVSRKGNGAFLYKVRPGSETSLAFGRLDGGEISAQITDKTIKVGGVTLGNNTFIGNMAGVVVTPTGGVSIGSPLPPLVIQWLSGK